MSYETHKAELPPTELGTDRCFQMQYYGHGDIFAAYWDGDLDFEPRANDDTSICFNLMHGSEVVVLASYIGYLRRLGRSEHEVSSFFLEAGDAVISDGTGIGARQVEYLSWELDGSGSPLRDEPELGLRCLMPPRAARPGLVESIGGAGLYTKKRDEVEDLLVWAQYLGYSPLREVGQHIGETASFCPEDMGTLTRLVCDLAIGEPRRDIRKLLGQQFMNEPV